MVKKSNGKWRVCTNYTNLNKACLKDAYPLPTIDKLLDRAIGNHLLSFLDAYLGYNKIWIHPQDEEKTAFKTKSANYCYQVKSFSLKNVGDTYQRLMDKIFKEYIQRNIEVYIDDMVVKSNESKSHAHDLEEIFTQIQKHNMQLNLEKCVFGV